MAIVPSSDEHTEIVAQETLHAPIYPTDPPSACRRFVNFLRRKLGMRSVELADRWADAKVRGQETDNDIKLIKARAEADLINAQAAKVRAEARKTDAEAGLTCVLADAIERASAGDDSRRQLIQERIEAASKTPAENWNELQMTIENLRTKGAVIKIIPPELPEPPAREERESAGEPG